MCYAKPGPRCSGHAKAARQKIANRLQKLTSEAETDMPASKRKQLDKKILKTKRDYQLAQRDYALTPDGANEVYAGMVKKYAPIVGEDEAKDLAQTMKNRLLYKRQEMVDDFNRLKAQSPENDKPEESEVSKTETSGYRMGTLTKDGLTSSEKESLQEMKQRLLLVGEAKMRSIREREEALTKENVYSNTPYYGVNTIRDSIGVEDEHGIKTEYTRIDYDKGVYPSEPYSFRIQVGREISPDEAHKLAGLAGYQYAQTGGERGNGYFQDTPNSIVFYADTTKGRAYRKLDTFVSELPATIQEGSPIRKTDRAGAGTQGTRKVEGMGDIGYVELYADYAYEQR